MRNFQRVQIKSLFEKQTNKRFFCSYFFLLDAIFEKIEVHILILLEFDYFFFAAHTQMD